MTWTCTNGIGSVVTIFASCTSASPHSAGTKIRLCEEPANYDVTLQKPLGLAFVERDDGAGLEVGEILPAGSAAADGKIFPLDLLLEVHGRDVSFLSFDDAMAALIDAPENCRLRFGRVRGRMAALRFSDRDSLVFARPGEALMPIARRARFDVDYQCYEGSCGVCDMVLRDGESGEYKAVRMCKSRIPKVHSNRRCANFLGIQRVPPILSTHRVCRVR